MTLGLVLARDTTPPLLPMARTTRGFGLSVQAHLTGVPQVASDLVDLPSAFCQLTQLRVLDLDKNLFETLPEIICEMRLLEVRTLPSRHIDPIST